jgi:hypothetical protein
MAFVKGKSGNPAGRPQEDGVVKRLARQHTTEAIERLVHWMREENPKASVSACLALLDRGYGKPAQSLLVSGSLEHRTSRELTEEELEHIATGGSAGAADEAQGSTVATPVH